MLYLIRNINYYLNCGANSEHYVLNRVMDFEHFIHISCIYIAYVDLALSRQDGVQPSSTQSALMWSQVDILE